MLRRQTAFSVSVIATLALGIGATTAIFSVVNGVILRALPFPDSGRLVQISETSPLTPEGSNVGPPLKEALRTESRSLEALSAYDVSARYLRGVPTTTPRVLSVGVDRTFFDVIGVAPIRGRTFAADDPATVAVVSEEFWTGRLVGDPAVIGRSIDLDGTRIDIIGVMPHGFQFPYSAGTLSGAATERRTELWLPALPLGQPARGRSRLIARLKADVTLAAAQAEADSLAARVAAQGPAGGRDRGVRLQPLDEVVVSGPARRALLILMAAVAMVLLLASANVANLTLVRATVRARELAVRTALGASPSRLIRQLLAESVGLAMAGGLAGLVLAWWGTAELAALAAPFVPRLREVSFDWRVFLFLVGVCSTIGILSGLAPALIAGRSDAQTVLQTSDARSSVGAGRRRLRDALVIVEVALAFVLALGATLLIRELVRLQHTATGLTDQPVVTAHLGQRMTAQTNVLAYYEIADRVAALPGVAAAGLIQMLPLQNWGWTSNSTDFRIRGRAEMPAVFPIELRYVTPGYFNAMGIQMRAGRALSAGDTREAPPVIVINETLARRYFADADSALDAVTTRGTIVGVIRDVLQVHLDRPVAPEIYYPAAQNWSQISDLGMTLVIRTERPEQLDSVVEPMRAVVREVNPALAVFDVKTMTRVVADSLSDYVLYLWLMLAFAGLAVMLAATGTYSVLAYAVTSRRREFAVRAALGAGAARMSRLVIADGARLMAFGLAVGSVAAVIAAPFLRNLPIDIRRPDAVTLISVAGAIALVTAIACLIPAVRAARVDPMETLRQE